jgi:hypothetical protein
MESAVRPFTKQLIDLEKGPRPIYDNLINFFCAFYNEWSNHYKEFKPKASVTARHDLRDVSLALSNIMFYPMFRLAFELWHKYHLANVDWTKEAEWKDALARLAGQVEVEVEDPDSGDKKRTKLQVMSRSNPAWRESIFVPRYNRDGQLRGWTLSSTRDTREAAYHYLLQLVQVGALKPAKPASGLKPAKKVAAGSA